MKERDLPMMPWYPKDFYAATAHLALAERYAYRTLLDYQWMLGVLPNDPKQLARLVGASESEFADVWPIVSKKFELTEDGYRNSRLEFHRNKALEVVRSRSQGARSTNAKRYAQQSLSDTVSEPGATRSSDAQRSHPNPNPNPNPHEEIIHVEGGSKLNGSHAKDPAIAEVFEHWRTVHRHPHSKLDAKRRKLILDRLKEGYTVEQLKTSISGYLLSAHHMGQNDKSAVYDSLELLLRDAKHVDQGLQFGNVAKSSSALEKPIFR